MNDGGCDDVLRERERLLGAHLPSHTGVIVSNVSVVDKTRRSSKTVVDKVSFAVAPGALAAINHWLQAVRLPAVDPSLRSALLTLSLYFPRP
jgi:hypothetical protein